MAVLYGWEGNRRSGIALAMPQIHLYGLNSFSSGDEHSAYTPLSSMTPFIFSGRITALAIDAAYWYRRSSVVCLSYCTIPC